MRDPSRFTNAPTEGDGAVAARNPHITIRVKVASNHGAILRQDFRTVAKPMRCVAG